MYSISVIFLLPCLLVILFWKEGILLRECSMHSWSDRSWWSAQSIFWLCILQSISLELRIIFCDSEGGHDDSHLSGWRNRSSETLSKLLKFPQSVSNKTRTTPGGLACLVVNTGKEKTQGALTCALPSVNQAALVFAKWFRYCHIWDLYQVLAGTHCVYPDKLKPI